MGHCLRKAKQDCFADFISIQKHAKNAPRLSITRPHTIVDSTCSPTLCSLASPVKSHTAPGDRFAAVPGLQASLSALPIAPRCDHIHQLQRALRRAHELGQAQGKLLDLG